MKTMMKNLTAIIAVAATGLGAASSSMAAPVVIGVPLATTGIYAFAGALQRNGLELALEELKASGNDNLKIIIEDTQSERNQAITLSNRLAQRDNAALIIGLTSTVETLAAAPISTENKLPFLSPASGNVTTAGEYIFKVIATPATIMLPVADYIAKRGDIKSVIYVFNRDNESYVAQKDAVKNHLESQGIKTISEEGVLGSDTDFLALATKLASRNADAIVLASTPELSANVIIQSRQAGIDPKTLFVGTPSMASPQFLKVGGKAVEGTVYVSDYFIGGDSDLNKKFVESYRARYKEDPDMWAAVGYTEMQLAAEAVRLAGDNPDRASLTQALGKIKDFPVVLGNGNFSINDQRLPEYGGFVLQIKDGKQVLVD
ncbi:ABC transporter substrate-binding protein [Alcaligenes endophyticus]|uniref:ABC transporter substrate-binding protein n=1 Tax=Alcaligenes endophyticus TaxID=1929088 RepID=A0ABT8EFT3_9BURK|nr:ABC transporter substrate-binding protein [Alcaligenes endophyticus]MCX5590301.1 ABC transporter substrate-binding protein [Alcaligenes endophyticus]MDN4120035.1 ABC transporter substrate-binding protein [Alcaligenes endophyticus]